MKWFEKGGEIEFFCAEKDWDVIARPVPAAKIIPDWFKALPPKLGENKFTDSTVKRCAPFLDAMTAGWIIPLAADVHMAISDNGGGSSYEWKFSKPMVENHNLKQVANNPLSPRPPMKWMNYWFIKVPKEYSLLFVAPLERDEKRFRCFSGLVDAPYAELEYVNFPFVMLKDDFNGLVEKGTPLIQAIPVRKNSFLPKAKFRRQTEADKKATALLRRQRGAHESHYRDYIRKAP